MPAENLLAPPANRYTEPIRFTDPPQVRDVVGRLQHLLNARGWAIKPDNIAGQKTKNAVTQAARHLRVGFNGSVVTPGFWEALYKSKPRSPIGLGTLPALAGRPRVLDNLPGHGGFPNGPGEWGSRSLGQIKGVCVHYTGGQGSFLGDARFHTTSSYLTPGGAPALAYHLGSDKDGTGRVFNLARHITWHCDGGQNTLWIGLVLLGSIEGYTKPQEAFLRYALLALRHGDDRICPKMGLPAGGLGRAYAVTTHRRIKATSCPGDRNEVLARTLAARFGLSFV